jgi:co-chaperonin GroES (HSP10)
MPAVLMAHETDPRADILGKIGDVSGVEITHNNVLLAIYQRPEKTKGGILLTQQNRGEDLYQGKVGLIVGFGPQAFRDPDGRWEWPKDIGLGDWVFIRASDGWNTAVNQVDCRMVADTAIRGRIEHPDQVW